MKKKRITLALTDEKAEFLAWLAKRDGISEADELGAIFWMEFDHEYELYKDEMRKAKE